MIFQRHEPATIMNEHFSFINIDNDNYRWMENPPTKLNKVNRYLIEKNQLNEFFDNLSASFSIYSCICLSKKAEYLTRIQKLILEKKILKNNWKLLYSIDNVKLFSQKLSSITPDQLQLIEDTTLDCVFFICNKAKEKEDLIKLSIAIDLLNQPKDTSQYFPTEGAINLLDQEGITLSFFSKNYYQEDINQERDIIICYSPIKL